MLDFHSHILPAIDDGSDSIATTIAMLQESKKQGIDWIIATPHYYPNHISFDDFIKNRKEAMNEVNEVLDKTMPNILLGAEVAYYYGISNLENIELLCVEGSKVLLLEMPMISFQQTQIEEVLKLQNQCGLTVVLAHIERYIRIPGNKQALDYLKNQGILFQVNGNYFKHLKTKRQALSLLEEGYIDAIGSDCHNMTSRKPNLDKVFQYIEKKGSNNLLSNMFKKNYEDLNISLKKTSFLSKNY